MRTLLLVVPLALAAGGAQAAHGARPDHEVKAAFLYNALQFTEWPDGTIRGEALNLCVAGDDAVARELPKLANKKAGTRAIRVLVTPTARDTCHVAYLVDPKRPFTAANASGMLTVASTAGEPRDLGTALVLGSKSGRVVFAVHLGIARDQGLKLSAKLLKLASTVRPP